MHPYLSSVSHSRVRLSADNGYTSNRAATTKVLKASNSLTPHRRSKSIPIGSSMKRTPSEQQLHEDEEMADWRDYVVFSRIAEGICRQQRVATNYNARVVNDTCLASIIGTRNLSSDELLQLDRCTRPLMQLPAKTFVEPTSLKWIIQHSFHDALPSPSSSCDDDIFLFEL